MKVLAVICELLNLFENNNFKTVSHNDWPLLFLTCDCDRFEIVMITHRNFHARTNFMCVAHYH